MPLDPDVATMLRTIEATGFPGMAALTPEQARGALRAMRPASALDPAQLPQVGSVEDREVAGLRARVYRPESDGSAPGPLPTVVYLHGGGFVIGDLDTHDVPARLLCRDVDAVVVSVDYRLAPEHPFPAAVEDATAALQAVADELDAFGGDRRRLVVAGDSAGANLATVAALHARDTGLPLAAQVLLYPTVDPAGDYPSKRENAEGYFLTATDMRWFSEQYTGHAADTAEAGRIALDPRVAPLRAERLDGAAPAIIATAEFDPLRDEGEAYADALRSAGVPVRSRRFDGLVHGFYGSPYRAAREATDWVHAQLREVLAG